MTNVFFERGKGMKRNIKKNVARSEAYIAIKSSASEWLILEFIIKHSLTWQIDKLQHV